MSSVSWPNTHHLASVDKNKYKSAVGRISFQNFIYADYISVIHISEYIQVTEK